MTEWMIGMTEWKLGMMKLKMRRADCGKGED